MDNTTESSKKEFKKSKLGNLSLVFGIISIITSFVSVGFLLGVIGLILGIRDLLKIKDYNQTGKGKIWLGITLSILGIIITIIFSIIAFSRLTN